MREPLENIGLLLTIHANRGSEKPPFSCTLTQCAAALEEGRVLRPEYWLRKTKFAFPDQDEYPERYRPEAPEL
jgi:hypothetical protein